MMTNSVEKQIGGESLRFVSILSCRKENNLQITQP